MTKSLYCPSVDIFSSRRKNLLGMAVMILMSVSACGGTGGAQRVEDHAFMRRDVAAIVTGDAQAALVGQQIMQAGGNAVDAAVASALALTVTMPSRVSVLGGGVCMVHDPAAKKVEQIDFLPVAVEGSAAGMPGMLRGLYALHARYGVLRFEQLVAPAEKLARFEGRVARGLVADLDDLAAAGLIDSLPKGGAKGPLRSGDVAPDLPRAALLAQIRQAGPGVLYRGSALSMLADATGIPAASIAAWIPQWRDVTAVPEKAGNEELFMVDTGAPATSVAVPAMGLVAKAKGEQVVACSLTQGGWFGYGAVISEWGTAPAKAVTVAQIDPPGMLMNMNVGEVHAAWAYGEALHQQMADDVLVDKIVRARASALELAAMPGGDLLSAITCVRDTSGSGARRCSAAIGAGRGGFAGMPE